MESLVTVNLRASAAAMSPADLTPEGLGTFLSAPASLSVRAAGPEIRSKVGVVAWMAAYPAWRILTKSSVLSTLLRVGIELALSIFVFPHAGVVRAILAVVRLLLSLPSDAPPVTPNWSGDSMGVPADPAERVGLRAPSDAERWQAMAAGTPLGDLLLLLESYRNDPKTAPTLDAVEKLLTGGNPLSFPARVGLGQAPWSDNEP